MTHEIMNIIARPEKIFLIFLVATKIQIDSVYNQVIY